MNPYKRLIAIIRREPAILLSLAGAGVSLGGSFGLHLDPSQTKAVYGAVTAVTAVLIRQSVSPTSKVNDRLAAVEAAVAALQTSVAPAAVARSSAEWKDIAAGKTTDPELVALYPGLFTLSTPSPSSTQSASTSL